MPEAATVVIRTVLFYFLVLAVVRIMGKREIGKLSPFDLVITIMIAEAAVMTVEDTALPISSGVAAIVTLLVLQNVMAIASMKSARFREVVQGVPSFLIVNGKLNEAEMRKIRYNVDDLMAGLREKGVTDITDVEFAILECSGKLSVIPVSQARAVRPEDLDIQTEYEGLPHVLVLNGKVQYKELEQTGRDFAWLEGELKRRGLTIDGTFFACLNADGGLYAQAADPSVRGLKSWFPTRHA